MKPEQSIALSLLNVIESELPRNLSLSARKSKARSISLSLIERLLYEVRHGAVLDQTTLTKTLSELR